MDLGTVLAIIALVLALIAAFIWEQRTVVGYRLLAAAVCILAVATIVGVGGLETR